MAMGQISAEHRRPFRGGAALVAPDEEEQGQQAFFVQRRTEQAQRVTAPQSSKIAEQFAQCGNGNAQETVARGILAGAGLEEGLE